MGKRDTKHGNSTQRKSGKASKTCTILSFFSEPVLIVCQVNQKWPSHPVNISHGSLTWSGERKRLRNSLGLQWNQSGHSHVNHLFFPRPSLQYTAVQYSLSKGRPALNLSPLGGLERCTSDLSSCTYKAQIQPYAPPDQAQCLPSAPQHPLPRTPTLRARRQFETSVSTSIRLGVSSARAVLLISGRPAL